MNQRSWRRSSCLLIFTLLAFACFPRAAGAHGPVAPVASSYLDKVTAVPGGFDVKVIDADQRLWLRAPGDETTVVLDYRGAPYLRFSATGVEVNRNSSMYYLNQTPAEIPPTNLTRTTPPSWHPVSGAHQYGWHDGRLHALATVALSPGTSYVGRWSIALSLDGRLSSISGTVWHADAPSVIWFWPIVVLLACLLAALRLRRPRLDGAVARLLATAALIAIALAGIGKELHGRPTVSVGQWSLLALILAFVGWMLLRLVFQRVGYFSYFVIAFVAIWAGIELLPTLLHGFVLLALPAFVARAAAVVCLGCGVALLLFVLRLAERPSARSPRAREARVEISV